MPAIHRNRAEVREIFRTRMAAAGRPAPDDLTDDPAELANAARLHLREKFLRAKVGVSGANFAVAETGTLVVVESEGNGRMCLTLPEVLVSVVGIEKVVPTWADLDVFLRLLPRSSTGERMNPYTSMWHGVTPGDGPQEVHVVLLDNGRTRALADEVGRQALRCIRCSACLNVCPVYERVGGHAYGSVYPGPIGAILNPLLKGVGVDAQTDSLPYASTLCGACYEVCPVKIDIPSILVDLRAQVVDAHRGGRPKAEALAMKGAAWTFSDARRLGGAERLSGLVGRVLGPRRAYDAPRRPARARPAPRAGRRLDRCPRPPGATARVVPRLVAAYSGRRDPARERPRRRPEGSCERPGGAVAAAPGAARGARAASYAGPRGRPGRAVRRARRRLPGRRRALCSLRARRPGPRCASRRRAGRRTARPRPRRPRRRRRPVDRLGRPDGLSAADLDALDAVVTRARLGIAETGTIVLDHGPGQGRRAITLVPDRHVCIVDAAQVVADVPDAFDVLDTSRPQTWVSGPSATSDIELDRVEGVHGPRHLHVIVVG